MKIETIDFFYLSMPEVLDIGDGSQDALLVRLQAGGYVGWGGVCQEFCGNFSILSGQVLGDSLIEVNR